LSFLLIDRITKMEQTVARTRVLVVDDDPALRRTVERVLRLADYEVRLAEGGREALDALAAEEFALVVLDVAMPPPNGLEVLRRLRAGGDVTPVLMLTARATVPDRVDGLEAGADDYLVKPFAVEELLARVRAVLRRAKPDHEEVALRHADLVLDPVTREVHRGERVIDLSATEFALLEMFLLHPRRVLSRSALYEAVWGYDFGSSSKSLDVYIGYLRRKTEQGGEPRVLHTVRGVGYVLRVP
jgi:two-component system response regulator MprA